jgi:hypothetical protein
MAASSVLSMVCVGGVEVTRIVRDVQEDGGGSNGPLTGAGAPFLEP